MTVSFTEGVPAASVEAPVHEDLAVQNGSERLTRSQVVDRILQMNPTATVDFLASFSDDEVREYLDHLQFVAMPRGRNSRWVPRSGVSAVAMYDSPD